MTISKKKRTVAQVLAAAADLISQGFTKNTFARTKTGRDCTELSRYATCYCTLGAIGAAAGVEAFGDNDTRYREATGFVSDVLTRRGIRSGIPCWNDRAATTQEDVVSVLREASEVAEEGNRD